MRKIILTRGHAGSGKSHALKAAGLEDWTLSSDTLRTVLASPVITSDGRLTLNQDVNQRVFTLLSRLADERMKRGETLAIDTTLQNRGDIVAWAALAQKHRYKIALLDMSTTSVEAAIARNVRRPETRRVPEYRIREVHRLQAATGIRDVPGLTVIQGRDDGSHVQELVDWLKEPILDLSGYRKVVHFGDLQGCYTVLAGPGGPLEEGFRDDVFYVFVGDLVDRGIENGKVVRWWLDNALGRKNVVLLWGNHEDHLHRWASGQEAVSNEFAHRTLPQLLEEGITPEDAGFIVDGARDFLHYRFQGREVLVTHAGLSAFPDEPHLISLEQYSKGTGYWSDPVDKQFERNTKDVFQVHGHRNHGSVPIQATPRSFNLEDSVEHGGHLRSCTLDASGWSTAQFRNHVFKSLRQRLSEETVLSNARKNERKHMPHWITQKEAAPIQIDPETLAAMRAHSGVREKSSERFPHVSSLNFTKRVFYERSWDDVVVKARGLFFNSATREIVARGYEKFFNIGEREDTSMEALLGNLKFPIKLYVKENGFLGNLGYDAQTDSLFVASKSTPDGPYADMFREILDKTLDDARKEKLRRYLRDTEASMTFEVIDPVNDPHMIEYPEAKIVLLDILHRTTEFERADYSVVENVGAMVGLETKKLAMTFRDAQSFAGWYKKAERNLEYRVCGEHVEGLVIEDAAGFMTKWKAPYYSFWKQMRGMKDRIVSAREKGAQFAYAHTKLAGGGIPSDHEVAMAEDFRDWCLEQDTQTLKSDIITLRKAFGRDFAMERTKVVAFT